MRFKQKDIREVWDKIKPTLQDTIHPTDRLEELYHWCRSGRAFYFEVEEGYIIVIENTDNDTLEKHLFLWIAYGEGINLIEKYSSDIDELARQIGAVEVVFRTTRKGFERALPEGWKMEHIEYSKRLT